MTDTANTTGATTAKNRPSHRLFTVTGDGESARWTDIGAAWATQDGAAGFDVQIGKDPEARHRCSLVSDPDDQFGIRREACVRREQARWLVDGLRHKQPVKRVPVERRQRGDEEGSGGPYWQLLKTAVLSGLENALRRDLKVSATEHGLDGDLPDAGGAEQDVVVWGLQRCAGCAAQQVGVDERAYKDVGVEKDPHGSAAVERSKDLVGQGLVEGGRDHRLSGQQAQGALAPGALGQRRQSRDRLARFGDDDFGARSHLFEKTGKVCFGGVDVDGGHGEALLDRT